MAFTGESAYVISVQLHIVSDLVAGAGNTGTSEQCEREAMDATMGRYRRSTFQPAWVITSLNKGDVGAIGVTGCDGRQTCGENTLGELATRRTMPLLESSGPL